ncbi:MAG TPA: TetR family transcriptional regulator C-terminal domain-containing protein [Steroidobacteraceae bacterium]|nr:TetR family transcriptional regulator C-terminal domain-containing protein [Steroidobacteraceae bacterium]
MSTRKKKRKEAASAPRVRNGPLRQRRRLIDACISALHLYGPSRTTVEKVVAIAKMSPGIVRFYFDSKAAMLVASLQFLAAEFEEQLLVPVAKLKSRPVAALELMVDLYLDPEIASPRKVSVWYAFWGEASSRQEYYDICGQKDESFAALVRELIERLIAETSQPHLDADGVALGLIGVLEILWQDFAFQTERNIDRARAKQRCMAYLRSIFPGQFADLKDRAILPANGAALRRSTGWIYDDARIHALERELLFQSAWAVVGHESQIPHPGDFLTIDIGVERALVVRDAAGAVHALRNSCPASPHALVASRSGHFDGGIECKLHRLRFSLDGRCAGGPGRVDLSVLDWSSVGGLMFARPFDATRSAHSPHEPGAWFDTELPQSLMMLRPPLETPVAADWKVVVERWLESSQDVSPTPALDSFVWQASTVSDSSWSGRLYTRLVECTSQGTWRRQFIAPNQLLETRPDGLSVMQALPIAPGRCILRRLDYTVLPPQDGARAALYLVRRLGPFARREMLDAAESVQKGMIEFGYEVAPGGPKSSAVAWFRNRLAVRIPALARDRPPTESDFNILSHRLDH